MIYNIVGDLLKQDKVDIICHQTNCKGVMGAGIAFQIKRAYPEVFKKYKEFCFFGQHVQFFFVVAKT